VLADDDLAFVAEQHRRARPEVVLGVWGQVLEAPPEELTALGEALLGAVSVPYLAVHGTPPPADYETWLRGVLPQVQLEVWGVGGHYPHLAEPRRFADRVAAFAGAP
jgi:pimeloyl-ACP methyl ester carboxylesterase